MASVKFLAAMAVVASALLLLAVMTVPVDAVTMVKVDNDPLPSPGGAPVSDSAGALHTKEGADKRTIRFRCYANAVTQGAYTMETWRVSPNSLDSCLVVCAARYNRGCRGFNWIPSRSRCELKKKVKAFYYYSGRAACKTLN